MEKLPSIIHESWHPYLQPIFDNDPYMRLLKNQVLPNCNFYPSGNHIFRVFSMPLDDIKVVILGQDPYPNEGQAIGYAFAVDKGVRKPVSLKNIEKEVGHELDETLLDWVEQGVFLLNTALTVEAKRAGSHIAYWHSFTNGVIRIISEQVAPIWLLWGRKAQAFKPLMKGAILEAPHPAAEAYAGGKAGFFGCIHFSIANQILLDNNKSTIKF